MENIIKQGKNVVKAHLKHLRAHNQDVYLKQATDFLKDRKIEVPLREDILSTAHKHTHNSSAGCPSVRIMDFRESKGPKLEDKTFAKVASQLKTWPIQIKLIPTAAPFFENADLLIAADCVPFAYANFHEDILQGKVLLVGCPKLDDIKLYQDKIVQIVKYSRIKSITYAHMEVPCCFGLAGSIKRVILESGKEIPFNEVVISVKGERVK